MLVGARAQWLIHIEDAVLCFRLQTPLAGQLSQGLTPSILGTRDKKWVSNDGSVLIQPKRK